MNRILSCLAISIIVCATSCTPALSEESTAKTVILPGMPGLEWMTENLSGFGGTEVDGRTYYTWEEAIEAAVKKLGNGWRLPTNEEFGQFCDLGSTWDDERKGRWFGGNHDTDHKGSLFMPAMGSRAYTTGALDAVGTTGYYWSSSRMAGDHGAGVLNFNSSYVLPPRLAGAHRDLGVSVRCVRNVE